MTRQERYQHVLAWFQQEMPAPTTELHYHDPFSLLVAVILSAQCTDKRVNLVTPALLQRFPDAAAMAAATPEEILPYISSVSYPNSKARHLAAMARQLISDFQGQVPPDRDLLQTLPGVGRKTANVMMAVAFNQPAMPVDTHVFRVAHRLGLVTPDAKTPLETERQLVAHIPADLLSSAHHWLILHGRHVCTARAPHCAECGLAPYCPSLKK